MAAPDWEADGVALLAELLWELVPEETVEGAERLLVPVGEVGVADGTVLGDVKLLATTVDVGTDPVLVPPVEVELATEVEEPSEAVDPVELPPSVEDPTTVELPEPELPVIPLRVKVPDQPW